ncbi:MAG: YvcK family protein [Armatimonadetes bacterium]|nr:YvcK family protein [Armatimonadota bacterium]
MINRYRVRRIFAPTKGLSGSLLLLVLGIACFLLGAALSFKEAIEPLLDFIGTGSKNLMNRLLPIEDMDVAAHMLGGALLLLGIVLGTLGARAALRLLVETLTPGLRTGMANAFIRRQQLSQGPHIVALGGGTGLSTLLRGLKNHTSNITAVVTVTDDGGSSGRLVQDKGMIPPGDIRNCLVALAEAERAMTDLFQHRFKQDSGTLSGHSVGNLLIAALVDQAGGDFEKAVDTASSVLNIRGRVVPSTLDHVRLGAHLEDGSKVMGETKIASSGKLIQDLFLEPADVKPHPDAIEAIAEADLICVGPGSVYTSLIPNLLVPGIVDAIAASSAIKVFVCNVMTQPGESDAFTASSHVEAVEKVIGRKLFNYVLVNTAVPSPAAIEKYREFNQFFVDPDADRIRLLGYRPVLDNVMSESDLIRHDPAKVAARLVELVT